MNEPVAMGSRLTAEPNPPVAVARNADVGMRAKTFSRGPGNNMTETSGMKYIFQIKH